MQGQRKWGSMKRSLLLALCVTVSGVVIKAHADEPVVIVTEEESKQPDAPARKKGFGSEELKDGPIITFNKPTFGSEVQKPVAIDISFSPRNAPIDLSSLKVTYVKFISIDITDRIKEYFSPTGVKIANASLPVGSHKLQFSLRDVGDHLTEEILKITVVSND
jgi:hypothetical protein